MSIKPTGERERNIYQFMELKSDILIFSWNAAVLIRQMTGLAFLRARGRKRSYPIAAVPHWSSTQPPETMNATFSTGLAACHVWTSSSRKVQSWSPREPWRLPSYNCLALFALSCSPRPSDEPNRFAKLAAGSFSKVLAWWPIPSHSKTRRKRTRRPGSTTQSPSTPRWEPAPSPIIPTPTCHTAQVSCKLNFTFFCLKTKPVWCKWKRYAWWGGWLWSRSGEVGRIYQRAFKCKIMLNS